MAYSLVRLCSTLFCLYDVVTADLENGIQTMMFTQRKKNSRSISVATFILLLRLLRIIKGACVYYRRKQISIRYSIDDDDDDVWAT